VPGKCEPTIKHQLAGALHKLGLQSRCQLIILLLR
jgi:DNA-binding CsgD family transcriptional regulator